MRYCDRCLYTTEEESCPLCGNRNLSDVQASDFCFLTEQSDMWAGLLTEILTDTEIEYITQPVYGAGMCLRTDKGERQRIYVPYEKLPKAQELMQEALSNE